MVVRNAKIILFSILLIIISSSVLGAYSSLGTSDGDFILDTGFFNALLDENETSTRAVSGKLNPFVSDLNGDGTNEIIIFDDQTIRLYQNKTLDILDSFNMDAHTFKSNIEIYDLDADGFKEIIYSLDDLQKIYIVEYNGSHIYEENTLDYSSFPYVDDGESIIKCGGGTYCLMAYVSDRSSANVGNRDYLNVVSFTDTALITNVSLDVTSGTEAQIFCFPKTNTMQYVDYDADGEREFIFGYICASETNKDYYRVGAVQLNASGYPSVNIIYSHEATNLVNGATVHCRQNEVGKYFTNALVFDIDGSTSNGLESVFGVMTDPDEFKMYSYSSTGVFIDDYPEIFEADGEIISSLFRANAFTDTGQNDFCVLGYQSQIDEIDLLCASEQTGQIPETQEFEYSISGQYNISYDYDLATHLAHAVQHSSDTTDGTNLNEILCTYGVFAIDYGINDKLTQIYKSPIENASVIAEDVQNVGRDDLLALTHTNIWYIDDGYTKVGGEIDAYTINPCIDSTWADNGTAEITITVTDADGDNVGARAILYYGDSNEQDSGWSINTTSGTTFPFNFEVNKTIGTGAIRLMGRDVNMPLDVDIIDLAFSVAIDGVVLGDCITSVDVTTSIEEEEAEEDEDPAKNPNDAIDRLIATTNENTGADFSSAVWWLIFMVAIAGALFWGISPKKDSFKATLGVISIVEVLMFIIGLKQGYLGVGTIAIVLIVSLVILSFKWNPFNSGGG